MKTPLKTHEELALAAARLSRAAPNHWADFLKVFAEHTLAHKDACVQAVADRVLITQGRAQLCVELCSLFTDAEKKAVELAAKQK